MWEIKKKHHHLKIAQGLIKLFFLFPLLRPGRVLFFLIQNIQRVNILGILGILTGTNLTNSLLHEKPKWFSICLASLNFFLLLLFLHWTRNLQKRVQKGKKQRWHCVFFWPGLVKNFPGEENKLLIAERNSGDQL